MSKIQKALKKLQAGADFSRKRADQGPNTGDATVELPVLATLGWAGALDPDQTIVDDESRVVEVHREALRDAGLLGPLHDERILADQYREIKRPLIANVAGTKNALVEDGHLVMITSALAGEGKSFTSINLALSIAREQDHSVLLVDADVAKPQISEIFGVGDQPGLLDVLQSPDLNLKSVILRTNIDGLSILPAGKPRANATELLSSTRMRLLLGTLRPQTPEQIVIFDSPPLLQTTEAKALASLAGQVVLVVRADATPHRAVLAALATLDAGKSINLVLNQARLSQSDYQYGYGLGYAYGEDTASKQVANHVDKSEGQGWVQ